MEIRYKRRGRRREKRRRADAAQQKNPWRIIPMVAGAHEQNPAGDE
jgi:hypothetical protein